MKIDVLDISGQRVGSKDLNPEVFDVKINEAVVHRAVVAQLSKKNVTAKTKDRGEVRGGGVKPWRQKGTGRARAGSIRSPIWKGGGKTFGPVASVNYAKKINRKEKKKALLMILSDKVKLKKILVVDDLKLNDIKTKEFVKILDNLKIKDGALVLINEKDEKLSKSARNVPSVKVLLADLLNVYDAIRYKWLIIDKNVLDRLNK